MFLTNLLTAVTSIVPSIGEIANISVRYEWICKIIAAIIGFAKDVGLGIILFTVILKLITLAPDVWSRVSMKKNALKMEAMKEDLEKLQKQYAKNKDLYQQKMMALYKKNGYSAFSACLPTIITLVFFFIVIGAFNSYSQVSERDIFDGMRVAYNQSIENVAAEENSSVKKVETTDDKGNVHVAYYLDYGNIFAKKGISGCFVVVGDDYAADRTKAADLIAVYGKDIEKIIRADGTFNPDYFEFKKIIDNEVQSGLIKRAEAAGLKDALLDVEKPAIAKKEDDAYYIIDEERFWEICPDLAAKYRVLKDKEKPEDKDETDYAAIIENADFATEKASFEAKAEEKLTDELFKIIESKEIEEVREGARKAAAEWYEGDGNNARSVIFPWVKNIWAADCSWTTALPASNDELSKKINVTISETDYEELTYNLGRYKEKGFKNGNGWFILVALSILSMAGSTIIMNKTQKTQMQLSSVDGDNSTAASTQKMMTWMMPIMFGIFSFIYSAAFSIYMVTNSLLSTGSTLLINLIVEKSFKKKIEKAEQEKMENHKYGKMR